MPTGGGGGTTSTVNQSNLPEYAEPYYKGLMERAQKESEQPYQPYKGDRTANQTAETKAGLGMATDYAKSGVGLLDQGAGLTGQVGQQALNSANYKAGAVNNTYTGPQQGNYVGSNYASQQLGFGQGGIDKITGQTVGADQVGFGKNGVNNVTAQQQGFGQGGMEQLGFGQNGVNQISTNNFNQAASQQYMSPYMDAVVNKAQSDAQENAAQAQATRNLQAAKAGSFGGSRAAVQNSIANNALQSNMTDIMVKGQQSAFENAQQQFNSDQARRLQADTTNQATGLSMGQSNQNAALTMGGQNQDAALRAQLANQQAGLTMGGQNQDANLRAMLANQSTNLAAQTSNQGTGLAMGQANQGASLDAAKLNEQSRQYGYGATEQAYQTAGQMGMDAQKATEQLRQGGQQLNLDALGLAGKSGTDLAAMQGQRDSAMQERIKAQLGVGQTLEDYTQADYDNQYQDFVNQRDSERQNLQFYSSLLQGVPISANSDTVTTQGSNPLQGAIGTAGGVQALYNLGQK